MTHVPWSTVRQALTRPYPVTIPMVLLVCLVPFYLVIAGRARGGVAYAPELPLDRLLPLVPASAVIYGALYAFLIALPVLVIQTRELVHRTVRAYLAVWITAYVCFWLYPTAAPRPEQVIGGGYATWGLRFLYDADPPFNCFPSLHVAHSFVSALACRRVHRSLGLVATGFAALVAISTLLTKQHYVLDVVAGTLMAVAAHAVFVSPFPRTAVADAERRVAPALALCLGGVVALAVACSWVLYRILGGRLPAA